MSHASHKWVSLVHIKEAPPCKYVNIKDLSLDMWHVPGRVLWMSILGKSDVPWCMSESYHVVVNELCLSWMRNAPPPRARAPCHGRFLVWAWVFLSTWRLSMSFSFLGGNNPVISRNPGRVTTREKTTFPAPLSSSGRNSELDVTVSLRYIWVPNFTLKLSWVYPIQWCAWWFGKTEVGLKCLFSSGHESLYSMTHFMLLKHSWYFVWELCSIYASAFWSNLDWICKTWALATCHDQRYHFAAISWQLTISSFSESTLYCSQMVHKTLQTKREHSLLACSSLRVCMKT